MMLITTLLLATAPLQAAPTGPHPNPDYPNLAQSAHADAAARPPASGATITGIFAQVYENWRLHCDVPGIRELRIAFDVELAANGAIVGRPVPVRPQNTPVYRAAEASALKALLDSSPFDVPEGYEGGLYRPTFNLARACAGS